MPKFDLNALIAKTAKARLQSGKAKPGEVKRAKKAFAQTVRKSAAKVQFKTKSGEKVSFTAAGKRDAKKAAHTNAYARYVRDNIGKYIPSGLSPKATLKAAQSAMKKVATDWNRRKSRRAA